MKTCMCLFDVTHTSWKARLKTWTYSISYSKSWINIAKNRMTSECEVTEVDLLRWNCVIYVLSSVCSDEDN